MAFAMRINFVDVICDNSLQNIMINGCKMGYQFEIMLSYYRGQFLSVIDEIALKVDSVEVDPETISFCLHGKEFGISELNYQSGEFWRIDEAAAIRVYCKDGIAPGEHAIELKLMFHSPYMPIGAGYMPIDGCGEKTLLLAQY
ncbi:MAG: DUF6379 domain-containing protein [Lachnospiraceae bacterium]